MEPVQAILAESLIGQILRKGLLQQLQEKTAVCDGCCNEQKSKTPESETFTILEDSYYANEEFNSVVE